MNRRFIPIALMMAMTLGTSWNAMRGELHRQLDHIIEQQVGELLTEYGNDLESFLTTNQQRLAIIALTRVTKEVKKGQGFRGEPFERLEFYITMEANYNSMLDEVNRTDRKNLPFYQKPMGLMYRVFDTLADCIQRHLKESIPIEIEMRRSVDAMMEALSTSSRLVGHFRAESLRLEEAGDEGIRLLCPRWPRRTRAVHCSPTLSNTGSIRLSNPGSSSSSGPIVPVARMGTPAAQPAQRNTEGLSDDARLALMLGGLLALCVACKDQ